jgi:hypothetical protein
MSDPALYLIVFLTGSRLVPLVEVVALIGVVTKLQAGRTVEFGFDCRQVEVLICLGVKPESGTLSIARR